MIIKCPSCESRFNLPDEKFQEGRKVRCSKCKHVFPLSRDPQPAAAPQPAAPQPQAAPRPAAAPQPQAAPRPAAASQPRPEPAAQPTPQPASPPVPQAAPAPEPRRPAAQAQDFFDGSEDDSIGLPGFSPDAEIIAGTKSREPSPFDFETRSAKEPVDPTAEETFQQMFSQQMKQEDPYNIDTAPPLPKATPRLTIPKSAPARKSPVKMALSLFLFIFLAVTAAGALAWFFAPDMLPAPVRDLLASLTGSTPAVPGEADPNGPQVNQEMVKQLELKDAEQHFVKNDKVGELLVIQGLVVNNSPEPRELIKVEANLYDENGVRLDTKQQLIGNAISLFQLQQLNREELEKALNNPVGITTQNTNIKPGATAPFMVIFYNPAQSVKEYQVVIVDAKTPPKQ